MFNKSENARWLLTVAVLLMCITVPAVYADDDDDDDSYRDRDTSMSSERGDEGDSRRGSRKGSMSQVANAKWKEECGSCHLAYPPRYLSAESWRAMMSGLDDHFGSDASLDVATATEIGNYLEQNASAKSRKSSTGIEPALRISDTRWFQSEHRKVADRTWKNPEVKSPSNCAACHTKAESGSYSERDIKMPR